MKTLISAGQAADMVWNALTTESEGIFMLREIRLHAAYLAYGYHKRYPVTGRGGHSFKYIAENDKLLNDLYDSIANDNIPNLKLGNAYEELSKIPHYEFEKNYPDILNGLNDKLSRNSGTKSDDYFTPPGITSLIAYFVNKEECKSVFDPFCGTASIVHKLQGGVLFEGQDIDTGTSLIARVNMEARYGRDKGIACCDSLYEWNNKSFDAVVSCPPYGISIPKRENGLKQGDGFYRDAEEMVIRNSLKINHAKISILLLHAGVLSQVRARRIRKFLLENNYLDTIISLPPNILYNSSTQYILLICKSDRKPGAPIRFAYAGKYVTKEEKGRNTFDSNKFLEALSSGYQQDCVDVGAGDIRLYEYSLNPSFYTKNRLVVNKGQRIVRPCDVLARVKPSNGCNDHLKAVPLKNFSNKYIEIVLKKNEREENLQETHLEFYDKYKGFHNIGDGKYLLVAHYITSTPSKYALYTCGESFKCGYNVNVFKINEDIIIPEYLVYCLTNNAVFRNANLSAAMKVPFVIDNKKKQEETIRKLNNAYKQQRDEEIEAENKRLGIKKPISDIEHMLGTTMHRIESTIARIEKSSPENTTYKESVKKLIYNVRYMMRVIKFTNSKIDSFNIKDDDICAFITEYEKSWRNYGDNYFQLKVSNEMGACPDMAFDKTMLTVMLDSILDNASRHGFHKKASENNKVEITLSLTKYEDKDYLLLRVANNGAPISEGFTIEDYVSRGRYTEATGRSGLGGSHVYEIVKGHNGYLCLDSNQIWNVVVEILLPIKGVPGNKSNMTIYENENKCI